MHVEHAVRIKGSVQDLGAALVQSPATWFPGLKKGNVASIGLHIAGIPLRKKVMLEFGESAQTSKWAAVPVTWKASSAEALFPTMTGKVSVSPLNKVEARLTVTGTYEPPLGKVGEELNVAVMHNVAKATVRELAELIADRLHKAVRR